MIYPININNNDDLRKVCSRIKTDPRALAYLLPKSNILHFYADKIDYRAAAFLKQELLARGGDTIVTKHVIDGKTEYSDVLLMATPSQLRSLQEKLKAMDCWGLKEFREELAICVKNVNINEWHVGDKLVLNNTTKIMAIMNLTPDSFYGPSRINDKEILFKAEKFLTEGAAVLDLGAESTRPGAKPVSEAKELERLLPALKVLRKEFPAAVISIDTYKANVARISVNEGADIINDISGFQYDEQMPRVIAECNIPYVLSHIKGTPENPATYENLLSDITLYFADKLRILETAGVKRENIIIDPGIGFGKSERDNFEIIKNLESFKIFGLPILVGHSRKRLTGKTLSGTLAITAKLYGRANLIRVHDVAENLQSLSISASIEGL